jgi:hypothetical protein
MATARRNTAERARPTWTDSITRILSRFTDVCARTRNPTWPSRGGDALSSP